jgi:ABC-type transporter Mla subunit MlaD
MSMLSISDKLAQLEDATAAAQSILSRKESELTYASEALSKAKSKLRSLNSEAQQTLHVNDTELPELISAELHAREEYNAAKARYEMNAKYLKLFREKMLREEKSSDP